MTTTTTTNPATTAPTASLWTTSRIVALVFAVLEVLLLVRFTFKLFGANAAQRFVSAIYAMTEPLVAPFRGIFAQPDGTAGFEIAALLSVVFFVLVAALILAVVRAYTGRQGEHDAPAPAA
ncbi:MAG TPA: YggT family protein [Candidatus Limnocylindria bacterium]|nr:YggT family protein [Candidatus Limnocylindria bacterium]